ncbi:MAG: JAB domain-containing protein [Christensenellales bacterium]|jgi:DNA repair protein RadC
MPPKKPEQPDASAHAEHRRRVRERYVFEGLDGFAPHEALEMLLFYAVPRIDVNPLAHRLLDIFGSLSGVLEAPVEELVRKGKVSYNTAVLLHMVPDMARYYHLDRWGEKPLLNTAARTADYAASLFMGRRYEAVYMICLNTQLRVNHAALLHEGTIDRTVVYPRLLAETALRHQAKVVILAHNHPGGRAHPSRVDMELTNTAIGVLSPMGIGVADHVIVAGEQVFSFRQQQIMPDAGEALRREHKALGSGKGGLARIAEEDYPNYGVLEEEPE